MARRPRNTAPVIDPRDGLRQRQRSDGSWRVWWEPTKRQAAAGARSTEFRADQPGHAQREATRLTREWTARAEGRTATAAPTGRSVSALISDYRRSRHFTGKAASTRRSYDTDMRAIEDKWGPHPIALFDAPMMDLWYEALLAERGVFRALAILTMMRTLLTHAERRGWRPKGSNPCRDLDMERPQGRQRAGTWEELDALLTAARRLGQRHLRLAILLACLGGQRQTDIVLARPEAFARFVMQLPGMDRPRPIWVWSLTRNKRGTAGHVPMHPEIVPALRTQLRIAGRGPGTLIWDTATGKPFTKERIWRAWDKIRAAAAETVPSVSTIQWRDLRRTFGNLSRAGGADRGDVADVLGNTADTNPALTAVYMAPQIATTWRATTAIERPKPVLVQDPERKKA